MTAWCEAISHRYEAVETQLPGIGWHFFAVLVGLLIRGLVGAATGVFTGLTAVAEIAVPIVLMTLLSFSLLLARKALRTS